MANVYELGLNSSILDDVLVGDKRIEGRLNTGKFATFQVGDRLRLRRDIYRNNTIIVQLPEQAEVEITTIHDFPDFNLMIKALGYERLVPEAKSAEEAASTYHRYYSPDEVKSCGVRAIHIKLIWPLV